MSVPAAPPTPEEMRRIAARLKDNPYFGSGDDLRRGLALLLECEAARAASILALIAAEREACAREVEEHCEYACDTEDDGSSCAVHDAADAIRARSAATSAGGAS